MRLTPSLHQILGTHGGSVLSHATDCNAFGIETTAGLVLFDAGSGYDSALAITALGKAGFGAGPTHLFLTHAHADHAGGTAALIKRYGTRVYAGEQTKGRLERADEAEIGLDKARRLNVYPSDYRTASVQGVRTLSDGAVIEIGGIVITAIETPGHSDDHVSYLVNSPGGTVLIAGDALFAGGLIILQDVWDSSVAKSCASIRRLSSHSFDVMLSGHGDPVLSNAKSHVDEAMSRINRLLPPRNFM